MLSPDAAMQMRNRIGLAGLDFRGVYQRVGIERETDTTPAQLARVEEIIEEGGIKASPPESVRAEAISAAAVGEGDAKTVEILVLSRADDGTVVRALYDIGPIAAKSLIWLLRDAVDEIEGTHTL